MRSNMKSASEFVVVANWKMNGDKKFVSQFIRDIRLRKMTWKNIQMVVCPPQVYLDFTVQVIGSNALAAVAVGAQDVWKDGQGAATGNTSAVMLADIGVSYVIIGHSERRLYNREDNLLIVNKFRAACAAGITPILCVGETAHEKQTGKTLAVLFNQLDIIVEFLREFRQCTFMIAYEPLWSIGSGMAADPQSIARAHDFIKDIFLQRNVDVAVLYGGSVSENNIAAIADISSVDGVLVGGASLSFGRLATICDLAAKHRSIASAGDAPAPGCFHAELPLAALAAVARG